ncbi:DeoR family transcriptional regulator [Yoonia sediminilitoris]|uniref:DeoR family transcriptional regulator n=1 Tax=Yoonia sediminilitoris TaxID=1286148 RepID=UPI0035C9C056
MTYLQNFRRIWHRAENELHETEQHTGILSAVQYRRFVGVIDLCSLTGASEARSRRDIATLHIQNKACRVRGGNHRREANQCRVTQYMSRIWPRSDGMEDDHGLVAFGQRRVGAFTAKSPQMQRVLFGVKPETNASMP